MVSELGTVKANIPSRVDPEGCESHSAVVSAQEIITSAHLVCISGAHEIEGQQEVGYRDTVNAVGFSLDCVAHLKAMEYVSTLLGMGAHDEQIDFGVGEQF